MRRVVLWLTGLIPVLAVAACGTSGASSTVSASTAGQTHRNIAGWTIYVPPGWHVVRFSNSKGHVRAAGIQLSNVQLPAPTLHPGTPIEVNGQALPPRGVGLVIAAATERSQSHGKVAVPPLPAPWPDGSHGWTIGSAPANRPTFEWLWFRANGRTYIAAVTIGWKASRAAQKALAPIVRSIKPTPANA